MALQLYMLGLVVQDMKKSLDFYRHLGLDIPIGSEEKTHFDIKMESGLTLFLDSNPSLWDPKFVKNNTLSPLSNTQPPILEFYLQSQDVVDTKYNELIGLGYQSHRPPYKTFFGTYFAMIQDPDGNTILLSSPLK